MQIDIDRDFDGKRLQIMRQVGFLPELRLRMTVRLVIPRERPRGREGEGAGVHQLAHAYVLTVPKAESGRGRITRFATTPGEKALSGRTSRCARSRSGGGELRTFASPEMILVIPQPGELYQEDSLDGQVKVAVNRLLSGWTHACTTRPGNCAGIRGWRGRAW